MEAVYLLSAGLGITSLTLLVLVCEYKIFSWIGDWFFSYKEEEEQKDEDK